MALPDVVVNVKSASTPRTLPTDTGTAFAVGVSQRGSSLAPLLLRSLQDFSTFFGGRLASSVLYDWVDQFFAEGGTRLFISRVFGSGAVAATRNLLDGAAGVSLVVTAGQGTTVAPDPGTWGNSLSVAVLSVSGGYQLQVTYNGIVVETSNTLVTQQDAVAWSTVSNYVDVAIGATALVPAAAAAAALTGGTDGAAVADADYQAALDRIPPELGPGQIAIPGQTTAARQLMALAHAVARNRFAQLDAPDSSSASTLQGTAAALYSAPNNGRRYGQLFAPWDVIPGLTANSTRTVPPSARACAQAARVDALGNPNIAAAGKNGYAQNTLDLSQPAFSDSDRLLLNNAGVTVSRRRYGATIATWGMRTLADQASDAQWSQAPNLRCLMAYVARAKALGDQHEFDQVDGFGRALSVFASDLAAAAKIFYDLGALYGATAAEAYRVDTGPGLNTPAQLQAGIMTAQVALRTSPSAEQVVVNIVKTPITQSL